MWTGPIKTIGDLSGPDSPGAQPFGATPPLVGLSALAVATPGPNPLPPRRASPVVPTFFLAKPEGPLTGPTLYVAQLPSNPPVAGDYFPGDTVRVLFTHSQIQAFVATFESEGGPAIGEVNGATVSTPNGTGYIDLQFNGVAWEVIGGGAL
jgi:hypothetical protein